MQYQYHMLKYASIAQTTTELSHDLHAPSRGAAATAALNLNDSRYSTCVLYYTCTGTHKYAGTNPTATDELFNLFRPEKQSERTLACHLAETSTKCLKLQRYAGVEQKVSIEVHKLLRQHMTRKY